MRPPRLRQRRDDPLDMVDHLISTIGPRRPTSLGEARAAAYIDSKLRQAGLSVNADTFPAAKSTGLTYPLLALLGIGTVVLAQWWPLWALLLALYGLLLAVSDALVIPLPALAPRRDSQNIVAIRSCDGADTDTDGGSPPWPRWRVVLLAPLDTPPDSSGTLYPAGRRVAALIGRIVAFVGLTVLLLLLVFDPRDIWRYGQAALAIYLLFSILTLPRRGNQSAALGSAGALAVLLAAAERLTALRSVEVWAVAVGASSTDSAGLQNLLLRYPFARENTLFLSLQHMGGGPLIAATREGLLRQQHADELLTRLAHEAAAADPDLAPVARPWINASSLAYVLHSRNYRALTLLSQNPRTPLTPPDSEDPDPAQAAALEHAAQLVTHMVQRLDALEQGNEEAQQRGA